jgi:PelA/Pel-15E family pectate lyase
LRYLAKVITSLGSEKAADYKAAFLRGMNYIFASQFPNGGWPQVWPLQGGYHDAITYNDGAMINILGLIRDVARGENEFAFVPRNIREQAAASLPRGIECILQTQIKTGSRRTVWCQQHDPLTLKPASARNYEMPAQCGSESAGITQFLMRISHPGEQVAGAIHAAAAWFEKTRLNNLAFKKADAAGKRLIPTPGAPPIWARFYEIGTDRPIFGDRDQTIHDVFEEISRERREGYSWFSDSPRRCLEEYAKWKQAHPAHD